MHPSISLYVITTRDKLINRIVGVAERPLILFQYLDHGARDGGGNESFATSRPSEQSRVILIGTCKW